ncbi:MAG: hypothetical protein IJS26_05655 [Alphaproteobacteria bacterium]|nr:hypothetical protein [Alphaproteobacteria bacterium]
MSWIIKKPSKDELIEGAEENIKYLEKELSNAKGYWYKLQMKIALKKEKEWLKELKQDE